jgi:hypothetical protein
MKTSYTLKGFPCISAALWLATVALSSAWVAQKGPQVFSSTGCFRNSALIVRGLLDSNGRLKVQEVFAGGQTNVLAIDEGGKIYQRLHASMSVGPKQTPDTIEVVAFLAGSGCSLQSGKTNAFWVPVAGCGGIAGLDRINVYLFHLGDGSKGFEGGWPVSIVQRDEHFSRDSFLAWVKENIYH